MRRRKKSLFKVLYRVLKVLLSHFMVHLASVLNKVPFTLTIKKIIYPALVFGFYLFICYQEVSMQLPKVDQLVAINKEFSRAHQYRKIQVAMSVHEIKDAVRLKQVNLKRIRYLMREMLKYGKKGDAYAIITLALINKFVHEKKEGVIESHEAYIETLEAGLVYAKNIDRYVLFSELRSEFRRLNRHDEVELYQQKINHFLMDRDSSMFHMKALNEMSDLNAFRFYWQYKHYYEYAIKSKIQHRQKLSSKHDN